ncbi:Urea amidolyase [Neonectria ditissima]|uniref:Urea amidolyase n=2 Tax=Eukaryota TaxID=2759 RepID=A0A0P7B1A3_9HYPO|nr:Urea amidolyase [Neonectria ditissima]
MADLTNGTRGNAPLTIDDWKAAQISGDGFERLCSLVAAEQKANESTHAWISLATRQQIEDQWNHLQSLGPAAQSLPLYGVPFAAKDNINCKGFTTTAACPTFSSEPADSDAPVIANMKAAGAIIVGKTNLDQFATGLVGTRSPYGAVPNSFDPTRVSGGSSSGSGVVVARGAVPFSFGTDTAGSGRVPAGLNNVIGLKPTRGALSARGVVPACRTLDCVSIFALTVADAETVLSVAEGFDVEDSYSRPRPDANSMPVSNGFGTRSPGPAPSFAICAEPDWFGRDDHYPAYEKALEKAKALGWILVPVDFKMLFQLAELLYSGPWVAERYEAIRDFIERVPEDAMDPVVRRIVIRAQTLSAADVFKGEYVRQDLTRQIQLAFSDFDGILTPTTPTFPTMEQLLEKPVEENSLLGTYTNFVNFLDWSALSIPAGFRPDGLPFSITLISNNWQEPQLLRWAQQWFAGEVRTLGATGVEHRETPMVESPARSGYVPVAVVGAHLVGFPLNKDLVSRGAELLSTTTTSKQYRLFALNSASGPKKPGLQRVSSDENGAEIEVEVWSLPSYALASFMATIPSPLGIGSLELKDSSWVHGFVCEPLGLVDATDITSYGSWRAYTHHLQEVAKPLTNGSPQKPISTVLVANRGEIAVRIIKTIRKMGLRAVSIYSDTDAEASHVSDADISLRLKGTSVSDTYLNIPQIIELAKSASADAVIPGYGFLAENADFATAVEEAGMKWVGPTAEQMSNLGLKHLARAIAAEARVPTVPGSENLLTSLEDALEESQRIGFPLMLKSTAGGGGIGLSHCKDAESLKATFVSVQRQASANFGNGGVFLERFVQNARHIEVQILGDGTGRVIAAGERDCSLQRRHQKVVEESPAIMVPEDVRKEMKAAAVRLAASVQFRNVGTVEFIFDVDTQNFYFLEVNTRLQVEHPVTESVTGLDLVECMLNIADGKTDHLFGASANTLAIRGASIEVRLYAESPLQSFRPCSGRITKLEFPSSLRVDTWVKIGTEITTSYDPLVAKLIASGSDRREALKNLASGLAATRLEGVETNLEYLRQIVSSSMFESADYTTKSLDTFQIVSPSFEILQPGALTTVQDYPGRIGYWSVGVPPGGPMDSFSFRLANRLVNNSSDAAGLECTLQGPSLRFHCDTIVAVTGGDAPLTLDNKPVGANQAIRVRSGQVLAIGTVEHGYRVYLAVEGGIQVPVVMGSRATFELGKFGGFKGRKLHARDILPIKARDISEDEVLQIAPAIPIPRQRKSQWTIRVVPGPHGEPDFFTSDSFQGLFSSEWRVHHNSNRLGVRLTGPQPEWARQTGGEAGLHPSNIHDSPYSVGSVSFTGDEAVVLACDGPSLGGFVVFCVIVSADMWKMGQVRPGDTIRFSIISVEEALKLEQQLSQVIENLTALPVPDIPGDEAALERALAENPIVVGRIDQDGQQILIRQAGDCAMLLEFGEATAFDLRQSFGIFAFCEHHNMTPIPGVEELTPGVFTLHITYSGGLSPDTMVARLVEHVGSYSMPTEVPSRIFHLPLAFNDSVNRAAVERYAATIRSEAPWLPSNVEFLEKLNGLDDISSLLHDANFLVLGLGDVFLGSPCAVPLDPRHRLFGTKYNPSRSFTPRGAVGIGGQYMCIYATDSPGGYQLVGRTVDVWDSRLVGIGCGRGSGHEDCANASDANPWMFRQFDRITFYHVSEAELDAKPTEELVRVSDGVLDLVQYEVWLDENKDDIAATAGRQAKAIASAPFVDDLCRPYQPTVKANDVAHSLSFGTSDAKGERVVAAMPGRCYKVVVKKGDLVKKGDVLVSYKTSSFRSARVNRRELTFCGSSFA